MFQQRFDSKLRIFLLFFLLSIVVDKARASAEAFPAYPEIRENVEFWKKVYGEYSSHEFVFHDSYQVMRVYGSKKVSQSMNPYSRSAKRIAKREKQKIKNILLHFAHGGEPRSATEKKIYALFPKGTISSVFRKAAQNLRTQLGQADRFRDGIIRSGRYMPHIKEIFKRYNLPDDLVYMPHVESSFNYKAYSKLGATGMWQFMRSTGRLYMKVGYTIDERLDPLRSTVAAAKLLRSNFGKLNSWPLAITAYNHGPAGMARAIKRLGTTHYPTIFRKYDGRRFGFASRNFYSEFLAAKEVAKNYQRYFGDLRLESPVDFETIRLPHAANVNTMIEHFSIEKTHFKKLNPAFRPAAYRYGRHIPNGYEIRLPVNQDKHYLALLDTLPRTSPRSKQGTDWFQVQPGDTLWQISRQLKVSMNHLIDLNELDGHRIYVGQILKVPTTTDKTRSAVVAVAKTEDKPVVAKVTKPQRTTIRAATKQDEQQKESTVVAASLVQPVSKSADKAVWQGPLRDRPLHGNLAVLQVRGEGSSMRGSVKIAPEETLGHLADWLSVPTQRIRDLNNFSFNRAVHLGQTVWLPLDGKSVEEFEERRIEYHRGLQEDFYQNFRVESTQTYTVKRGDSIWRLCQQTFELPAWVVRDYNPGINLSQLKPGDQLHFPVVVPLNS